MINTFRVIVNICCLVAEKKRHLSKRNTAQKTQSLSSMTSKICAAIGTRMAHIHALIDAAWNQTAAQPTAEKCNQKSRHPCNDARRCGRFRVDLTAATWTDGVRRVRSKRHDGGDNVLCGQNGLLRRQRLRCIDTVNCCNLKFNFTIFNFLS